MWWWFAEGGHVGDCDGAGCYFLRSAFEAAVVYQGVAERHDVGAHPVLMFQIGDRGRMGIREHLEEADVKPSF